MVEHRLATKCSCGKTQQRFAEEGSLKVRCVVPRNDWSAESRYAPRPGQRITSGLSDKHAPRRATATASSHHCALDDPRKRKTTTGSRSARIHDAIIPPKSGALHLATPDPHLPYGSGIAQRGTTHCWSAATAEHMSPSQNARHALAINSLELARYAHDREQESMPGPARCLDDGHVPSMDSS